jgi:nucleotide-binding universal stress UspA family protein
MKFLVGFDGSNPAKEALALAVKHAKAFNASIDIVTSMEAGTMDEANAIEEAQKKLEYAEASIKQQGIQADTHLLIRGMKPGEDLVAFAKDSKTEAIFIGLKRRSKVGKLLFGSNAQYIILKAPCPVMTVK